MKMKGVLKGVAKIGWFAKVIRNIWTKEYQKPTSHPFAPYLSSRIESFHN
jgi:hypothetical protein